MGFPAHGTTVSQSTVLRPATMMGRPSCVHVLGIDILLRVHAEESRALGVSGSTLPPNNQPVRI